MNTDPDPIRILGFEDQKFKKITAEKKSNIFLIKKLKFTGYLPLGLHKGRPSYRRSFSTSKHEFFKKISIFMGHFCPPGSGSGFGIRIRIVRIQ
jgi:hypothetical protein